MKKILFGFFLMSFSLLLSGQHYKPFPDSNAIWRVDRRPYGVSIGEYYLYQYTIKGDTVIGGNDYKIINRSGKKANGTLYFNVNIGFIRDDTVAKKFILGSIMVFQIHCYSTFHLIWETLYGIC